MKCGSIFKPVAKILKSLRFFLSPFFFFLFAVKIYSNFETVWFLFLSMTIKYKLLHGSFIWCNLFSIFCKMKHGISWPLLKLKGPRRVFRLNRITDEQQQIRKLDSNANRSLLQHGLHQRQQQNTAAAMVTAWPVNPHSKYK